MLNAANVYFRALSDNFVNFSSSASSVDRASDEIYSPKVFYISFTTLLKQMTQAAALHYTMIVSLPVLLAWLPVAGAICADQLSFGFVACRDSVPSVQRLAVYVRDALD